MARGNGRKIEVWSHPKYTSVSAEIRLHLSGEFFAEYNGARFTDVSLENLRKKLLKASEEGVKLDWIPVITLRVSGNSDYFGQPYPGGQRKDDGALEDDARSETTKAELRMDCDRSWMAKKPDGEWLECTTWYSEDFAGSDHYDFKRDSGRGDKPLLRRLNSRKFYWHGKTPFSIPCLEESTDHSNFGVKTHYIAYTEELWAALNDIARRVELLKNNLDALLGDEQKRELLVKNVARLLPA